MRLLIAALAMILMVASAQAQQAGSQLGQHAAKASQQADKNESSKPKVDDKAYNAALRNLPDKHYDPWHGVR